jgi:hypothetical protein
VGRSIRDIIAFTKSSKQESKALQALHRSLDKL